MESLIIGADGLTRGAVVKAASTGRPTVLRRPVQLLYPLEVHNCDGVGTPRTDDAQVTDTDNDGDASSAVTETQPRRRSKPCCVKERTRVYSTTKRNRLLVKVLNLN